MLKFILKIFVAFTVLDLQCFCHRPLKILTMMSLEVGYLSNYHELFYDTKVVHDSHERVSRSINKQVDLSFKSYGRIFNLKLTRQKPLFENDYIELNGIKYPTSDYPFYEGKLNDDPNSYVHGSIIDGVFYGTIMSKYGKYHIESTKRHQGTFKSHSLMYHESDLVSNHLPEHYGCASEKIIDNMKEIQEKAFQENNKAFNHESVRKKRQTTVVKNVCDLYLKVDPFYYKEIYNNEGGRSDPKTLSFIVNYLNKYVVSLNSIYSTLEFFNSDKTESYKGIKFSIYRTRIITETMCLNGTLSDAEQKLCEKYVDVQTFLNYVSLDDYSRFCLSYTFTARDFADGTLGLAWLAKPSGIGGICTARQEVQGVDKSLNCGIVTIMNYQTRLSDKVTMITFAHEVGHNFGAEHDPTKCVPGGNNGNFIMYAQATTGLKANNDDFSECSKESMSAVVYPIITDSEISCFKTSATSICGNMIVEQGEECDCGYSTDCNEKCCYSADEADGLKCKLKSPAICSPSQGSCCNFDCTFSNNITICYKETECKNNVFCSGSLSSCPFDDTKYFKIGDNGSLKECNGGTQVCKSGACTGSICEKFDMTQCYLEGDLTDKNVDKVSLCHLACISSQNDSCISTFNMALFNYSGFILNAGAACSGTKGYCDIFSKCRTADEGSLLARIEELVLNPPTSQDVQTWFQKYWWTFLLIFLGFIFLVTILAVILFKITPTSNPKKSKTIIRKLSQSNKAATSLRKRNTNY